MCGASFFCYEKSSATESETCLRQHDRTVMRKLAGRTDRKRHVEWEGITDPEQDTLCVTNVDTTDVENIHTCRVHICRLINHRKECFYEERKVRHCGQKRKKVH